MILHIIDDEKVTSRTISLFEDALPGENLFLIRLKPDSRQREYYANVIQYYDDDNIDLDISIINKVIIHGLWGWTISNFQKLLLNRENVMVYWALWGSDMYNEIIAYLGYNMYYEPRFAKGRKERILNFLKIKTLPQQVKNKIDFIRDNVDIIMTLPEEWALQNEYLGDLLKTKKLLSPNSIYYSLEDILSPSLMSSSVSDSNILICNSGAVSNNHAYALKYLSRVNVGDRKIVVPMSYAGYPQYINHIKDIGFKIWGNKFSILEDFLPLDEYNLLMQKSGVCIFSSWRQQAIGNIVIALFLGAQVFLSNRNPTYHNFKKRGLIVFAIEDISQQLLDMPLTKEQRLSNKTIITDMFRHEIIISEIRKYFE